MATGLDTSLIAHHPEAFGDPEHWTVKCPEHQDARARLSRTVFSAAHAANLEAKHLREYHVASGFPALNLSAVCTLVLMAVTIEDSDTGTAVDASATAVLGMWEALTGLPRAEAVALAQRVQASAEPTTAHVAPF